MASFLPRTDGAFATWALNFRTLIGADPAMYGVTVDQSTQLLQLQQAYAMAYQEAIEPSTRTKGKILAKNDARDALKTFVRFLAKVVEGQPTVTNEQKVDLGLNVRKNPTPVPPPPFAPDIDILSLVGRRLTLRLHNSQTVGHRRKPAGVKGATLFSYVGEAPPVRVDDWKFEGSTTKTVVTVDFAADLEPGTKVWVTCFWFNGRSESGPAATPMSVRIQWVEQPQLKLAGGSKKAA
jgi:hypothetical protein